MAELILIDTSILIDFRRNHADATPYVLDLVSAGVAAVHPVVACELIEGVRDRRDLQETLRFLPALRMLQTKRADFDVCIDHLSRLRLASHVGWPDCLIAATCMRLDCPVATLNDRHFRSFRGLRVIRPY